MGAIGTARGRCISRLGKGKWAARERGSTGIDRPRRSSPGRKVHPGIAGICAGSHRRSETVAIQALHNEWQTCVSAELDHPEFQTSSVEPGNELGSVASYLLGVNPSIGGKLPLSKGPGAACNPKKASTRYNEEKFLRK